MLNVVAAVLLLMPPMWLTGPSGPTGRVSQEIDCHIASIINSTETELDDFVVLSDSSLAVGVRPSTPLSLILLISSPVTSRTITLRSNGNGGVDFSPKGSITLTAGKTVTLGLFGDKASLNVDGTSIIAEGSGFVCKDFKANLTVITGIKIAYRGKFYYAASNSEAGNPDVVKLCQNPDAILHNATPLKCEGLAVNDHLIFEEDQFAKERFTLASKQRPKIEVTVKEVKSFGPEVILTGRDPDLTNGTDVKALAGEPAVAFLVPGNCTVEGQDGKPLPLEGPGGTQLEFEKVLKFGYRFGDAFHLKYPNEDGDTVSHVWRFNVFDHPEMLTEAAMDAFRAGDLKDIKSFFSGDIPICTDENLNYLKRVSSTFADFQLVCQEALDLKQLFVNNAGERAAFTRDWANWTSRRLKLGEEKNFKQSFIARLFDDAIRAKASNTNRAEAFLQLSNYDWYTLMGDVEKGVAATPGGIDKAAFPEFLIDAPCPTTTPSEKIRGLDPFEFPISFPPPVDPDSTVSADVLKKALDAFTAALTACSVGNHTCGEECVNTFKPPPADNVLRGLICLNICAAESSVCTNDAKAKFAEDLKILRR